MPAYLVVVIYLAVVLLIACAAAGVLGAIGKGRLGRWLRLDVVDGDE